MDVACAYRSPRFFRSLHFEFCASSQARRDCRCSGLVAVPSFGRLVLMIYERVCQTRNVAGLTMRCSEPGLRPGFAIHASRGSGRRAWGVRLKIHGRLSNPPPELNRRSGHRRSPDKKIYFFDLCFFGLAGVILGVLVFSCDAHLSGYCGRVTVFGHPCFHRLAYLQFSSGIDGIWRRSSGDNVREKDKSNRPVEVIPTLWHLPC